MARVISNMDKRTPSDPATMARFSRGRIVLPPQRHEGLGNALRAAFEPSSYGLPTDMQCLLSKLDR